VPRNRAREAHQAADTSELGPERAGVITELEDLVHQPFEPAASAKVSSSPGARPGEAGVLGEERRGRGLDGGERRPSRGDPVRNPARDRSSS
jgi:hypothetical protein